MDKYKATIKLTKSQYEMLRKYYDKRMTVSANTLVELTVTEVVKRAAEQYIAENGYAPIVPPRQ